MAALNKVILIGHICVDPEVKKTNDGNSVVSFTIGIGRRVKDKDESDFIDIVAWRERAEFVGKYFRKGDPIQVVGQIRTRTYEDKEGKKRKVTEVLADEIGFVQSKKEKENGSYTPKESDKPAYSGAADLQPVTDDGDLPF